MAKSRLDFDDYSFDQISALARLALRDPYKVPVYVYKNMECDLFSSDNKRVDKLLKQARIRRRLKKHAKNILMTERHVKDFFRLLNSMRANRR